MSKRTSSGTDSESDDRLPEAEAEARYRALVGNLVNTPHKPHLPTTPGSNRRPRRDQKLRHSGGDIQSPV